MVQHCQLPNVNINIDITLQVPGWYRCNPCFATHVCLWGRFMKHMIDRAGHARRACVDWQQRQQQWDSRFSVHRHSIRRPHKLGVPEQALLTDFSNRSDLRYLSQFSLRLQIELQLQFELQFIYNRRAQDNDPMVEIKNRTPRTPRTPRTLQNHKKANVCISSAVWFQPCLIIKTHVVEMSCCFEKDMMSDKHLPR